MTMIIIFYITKISIGIVIGISIYFLSIYSYLGVNMQNRALNKSSTNKTWIYIGIISMFIYIFIGIIDYYFIDSMQNYHINGTLYADNPNTSSTIPAGESSNTSTSGNNPNATINTTIESVHVGGINLPIQAWKELGNAVFNGGIMSTAIAGSYKIATTQPSLAGKALAIGTGLAVGGLGIITKDKAALIAAKDISTGFIDLSSLSSIIPDTGNNSLDLLMLLQIWHNLELLLVVLICVYFGVSSIYPTILKYTDNLPISIRKYTIKWLNYTNMSAKAIILISLAILLYSLVMTNHYFNFVVDNFQSICEYAVKNPINK